MCKAIENEIQEQKGANFLKYIHVLLLHYKEICYSLASYLRFGIMTSKKNKKTLKLFAAGRSYASPGCWKCCNFCHLLVKNTSNTLWQGLITYQPTWSYFNNHLDKEK